MTKPDPKFLSFEQREGVEPLPAQLQLKEVSPKLRAVLWQTVLKSLEDDQKWAQYSKPRIAGNWRNILLDYHVHHEHRRVDKFTDDWKQTIEDDLGTLFEHGQ